MVLAKTKLIVGLGNPGREYEKTRHNLGFMVVQRLAETRGADFKKCRYASALTADVQEGDVKAILALPQTFMNNSGLAVRDIMKFENVALEDVLIVCDDLRLDVGQLKLRLEGSDAGHNGLKSIAAHVGTEAYARLKLGIGEPKSPDGQTDFVLSRFSAAEIKVLEDVLESACDGCRLWLTGESARAMTLYNKRKDNE
jgi:PTH1 family peptidyl-tRNA hydrolase